MEHAYFVTIFASDRPALLRLASYELDLIQQTAATAAVAAAAMRVSGLDNQVDVTPDDENATSIDGLLTIQQIVRLVDDGYQLLVREAPASVHARRRQCSLRTG